MVPSLSRESEFDLLSFHDNNLIFCVFVIVHLCICKFWRWVDLWAECRNILWNSKLCPRFTIGQINKVTLKLYLTTLSRCVCHAIHASSVPVWRYHPILTKFDQVWPSVTMTSCIHQQRPDSWSGWKSLQWINLLAHFVNV